MKTQLRIGADGVVEVWRGNEMVGQIEPTVEGIAIALGDADPPPGLMLIHAGEPFRLDVDFLATP